eukprot:scaffold7412_cov115-Cylindrotheca_fusiformis.AAC.4
MELAKPNDSTLFAGVVVPDVSVDKRGPESPMPSALKLRSSSCTSSSTTGAAAAAMDDSASVETMKSNISRLRAKQKLLRLHSSSMLAESKRRLSMHRRHQSGDASVSSQTTMSSSVVYHQGNGIPQHVLVESSSFSWEQEQRLLDELIHTKRFVRAICVILLLALVVGVWQTTTINNGHIYNHGIRSSLESDRNQMVMKREEATKSLLIDSMEEQHQFIAVSKQETHNVAREKLAERVKKAKVPDLEKVAIEALPMGAVEKVKAVPMGAVETVLRQESTTTTTTKKRRTGVLQKIRRMASGMKQLGGNQIRFLGRIYGRVHSGAVGKAKQIKGGTINILQSTKRKASHIVRSDRGKINSEESAWLCLHYVCHIFSEVFRVLWRLKNSPIPTSQEES